MGAHFLSRVIMETVVKLMIGHTGNDDRCIKNFLPMRISTLVSQRKVIISEKTWCSPQLFFFEILESPHLLDGGTGTSIHIMIEQKL